MRHTFEKKNYSLEKIKEIESYWKGLKDSDKKNIISQIQKQNEKYPKISRRPASFSTSKLVPIRESYATKVKKELKRIMGPNKL